MRKICLCFILILLSSTIEASLLLNTTAIKMIGPEETEIGDDGSSTAWLDDIGIDLFEDNI